MANLPIFIENSKAQEAHHTTVVSQARLGLFKRGVFPLPFASSKSQVMSLLHAVRMRGHEPSLFVVNLSGFEDELGFLDEVMGDTPVLFFRRELIWLKESRDTLTVPGLTTRIDQMRPRLSAIWRYGPANAVKVARRAAFRIEGYLSCGDFRRLEGSLRMERIC